MNERFKTENPELNDLFDRYRRSPEGHVFAPLADACRKAGMLEEAVEICEKGLGANPRYASGYVIQGKTFFDMGDNARAGTAFRRVLEIDENNLVALKYLGVIAATRGQGAKARNYFEHILALDPENREIRERMSNLEDSSRTEDDSPETRVPLDDESFEGVEITLGSESRTSDVLATMTLADIYAVQGYKGKALRIYRDLLKEQPDNADVRAKIDALENGIDLSAPEDVVGPGVTVDVDEPTAAAETPKNVPPGDQSRNHEQFKRWIESMNR